MREGSQSSGVGGQGKTVLAHKTAPVLILNMHLTGRIATGLFALLAHKTAPHGLFALPHGALETRTERCSRIEVNRV
jgi:hypothetical protein